jgi:isocitrate dehydrogenase kinase/phosphatase
MKFHFIYCPWSGWEKKVTYDDLILLFTLDDCLFVLIRGVKENVLNQYLSPDFTHQLKVIKEKRYYAKILIDNEFCYELSKKDGRYGGILPLTKWEYNLKDIVNAINDMIEFHE